MHLTSEQRALAEQAMEIVPKAIAAFYRRHPHLRRQLLRIDSQSVAYLAICRAARTYDPSQSQVTTYFSTAIRNAVLKELDRNRRQRYDSPDRLPLEMADELARRPKALSGRLQAAIARLPAKARRLVQARYYKGLSLREMADQSDCDPRTIGRRLASALAVLQKILESEPLPP